MLARRACLSFALLMCVQMLCAAPAWAADPPEADEAARHQQFKELLDGATLVGKFTIVGKENDPPREERYVIRSVMKMEEGDYWLFTARVKYGDKDVTLPMPLEVKWAGDTPVITLSKTTLPGLGTFSARVVIHNNWYAGTWIHDNVGGHLFGKLERTPAEQQ